MRKILLIKSSGPCVCVCVCAWVWYSFTVSISLMAIYLLDVQKNIYFCFIDYTKASDCVDHNKLWKKFFKRWKYQTTLPVSWEISMQIKKQQSEQDMKQWTDSKLGKKYVKAVYCRPAYSASIQSTSCEMPGWMKTSWNQDCGKKYQ